MPSPTLECEPFIAPTSKPSSTTQSLLPITTLILEVGVHTAAGASSSTPTSASSPLKSGWAFRITYQGKDWPHQCKPIKLAVPIATMASVSMESATAIQVTAELTAQSDSTLIIWTAATFAPSTKELAD